MTKHVDPERRHDFVLFFDVTDGNPNGDPDAGNLPRVDPETMQGLTTDVCLKRKIRNFVGASKDTAQEENSRYKIYVEEGGVLNEQHGRAYEALDLEDEKDNPSRKTIGKTKQWMCKNFFDVRMFGAVMTTGVNCGQVRGPVQLTFARSIDPVVPTDVTLTRVAVTRSEDAEKKKTEMGRKAVIPYGLYRAHGFFNPVFARDTQVDAEDLQLLWKSLQMMWDLDRSASRGMLAPRGLYVFSHDHYLGDAPAHQLFDRVEAEMTDGVEAPRSFDDYEVTVDDSELPEGISLTRIIG